MTHGSSVFWTRLPVVIFSSLLLLFLDGIVEVVMSRADDAIFELEDEDDDGIVVVVDLLL